MVHASPLLSPCPPTTPTPTTPTPTITSQFFGGKFKFEMQNAKWKMQMQNAKCFLVLRIP